VEDSPVTVASASGSVYAAAAARAERQRREARTTAPPSSPKQSIYDASLDTGVRRR
jgi:hypothetical protein